MSEAQGAFAPRPLNLVDRLEEDRLSLPEVNGTVAVPQSGRWFLKLFAFMGPGYMVSVGYMDPGTSAHSLAGGAQFCCTLLFVIMLSTLMAILLQALAAR